MSSTCSSLTSWILPLFTCFGSCFSACTSCPASVQTDPQTSTHTTNHVALNALAAPPSKPPSAASISATTTTAATAPTPTPTPAPTPTPTPPPSPKSSAVQSNANDARENVENYAQFGILGTSYLAFRDINNLITRFSKPGAHTLDYGCGAGRSTRFLKSIGLNVTDAVDISGEWIKKARQADQLTSYHQITSGTLPQADSSFDLVFSSFVLFDIPNKIEMKKALQTIHRVLKKGGVFIAVTGSELMHSPAMNWVSYMTHFEQNRNPKTGAPIKIQIKGVQAEFIDFFWTKDDYLSVFGDKQSGFNFEVAYTHQPMGLATDPFAWESEKTHSPYYIFVLRKA